MPRLVEGFSYQFSTKEEGMMRHSSNMLLQNEHEGIWCPNTYAAWLAKSRGIQPNSFGSIHTLLSPVLYFPEGDYPSISRLLNIMRYLMDQMSRENVFFFTVCITSCNVFWRTKI